MPSKISTDVCIVGAGISGIITAIGLLDHQLDVVLVDRDLHSELGGLAKWAFGGMFFVDTKHQRKNGISDSIELAKRDWYSYAKFDESEIWGKRWADKFIESCTAEAYEWLQSQGISFFRVINWAERGMNNDGNSVPRFHMVWGTGWELVKVFKKKLLEHKNKNKLTILCQHRVLELTTEQTVVTGCEGINEKDNSKFTIQAKHTIIATGGINGSIEKVKKHWNKDLGSPPVTILSGAHQYAIGDLHDAVLNHNGNVANLEKQWNYAQGIKHYKPRKPNHGLSLVPCKSALWLDASGKRFGPEAMVTGYDTSFLVKKILAQEHKYSWQILNRKIALKEFAISGSEHNPAIRDKKLFSFLKNVVFGNKKLVDKVIDVCEDIVASDTLEGLVDKMNALNNPVKVELKNLQDAIYNYDENIDKGDPLKDPQLALIKNARKWKGDRARTCNLQKIASKSAGPFIAIRSYILSRKSLGGIQTDLSCKVLSNANKGNKPIEGLYAIGEAAGFGGGGLHGSRSLEGTFLSGCVITARQCVKTITTT